MSVTHSPVEPRLRPLRADDAADVLAAFTSAADMARQGDVSDLASAVSYLQRLLGEGRHAVFGIVLDDRVVGGVGLTLDPANRNGWFWYWMHAAFRGRGWTSQAAATVADWALTDGGLDRLELGHRVNNPGSERVALAAGFVREGVERGKLLVDDDRIDVVSYGRLPHDPWPTVTRLPLALVAPAPIAQSAADEGSQR